MDNKPHQVFHILQSCKSDMARYKFAVACMKLKKHKEGEKMLLKSSNQ